MWYLQFEFSNGSLSPEKTAYKESPNRLTFIPPQMTISKGTFKMYKAGEHHVLYGIIFEDSDLECRAIPKDMSNSHFKEATIELEQGD